MGDYVQIGWCVMKNTKRRDGTTKVERAIQRTFFNRDAAVLYAEGLRKQGVDAYATEDYGSEKLGK